MANQSITTLGAPAAPSAFDALRPAMRLAYTGRPDRAVLHSETETVRIWAPDSIRVVEGHPNGTDDPSVYPSRPRLILHRPTTTTPLARAQEYLSRASATRDSEAVSRGLGEVVGLFIELFTLYTGLTVTGRPRFWTDDITASAFHRVQAEWERRWLVPGPEPILRTPYGDFTPRADAATECRRRDERAAPRILECQTFCEGIAYRVRSGIPEVQLADEDETHGSPTSAWVANWRHALQALIDGQEFVPIDAYLLSVAANSHQIQVRDYYNPLVDVPSWASNPDRGRPGAQSVDVALEDAYAR